MATSREHFALDWIKGELLETLNAARAGLEAFAEVLEGGDAADSAQADEPLRECVNGLHQVHGTLVMLELKGVTLLADHLERVAEELMNGRVDDVSSACQSLMQGILELPGYLDELQSGLPDSSAAMLPLTNELRRYLGDAPLAPAEGVRLYGVAGEAAIHRFEAIGGVDKTRKIRAVYQQVLLSLLKGGELGRAVETLRKVAQGMFKVCEGTPFAAQWLAFGEFVESLTQTAAGGALDGAAVKLLRRVDSEIREIAQSGSRALQRPVSINLVRQLLDAAAARGRHSDTLDELRDAAAHGEQSDSLSLSGRQALVSAATALREELGTIKDRLDLFVRGGGSNAGSLGDLLAPLKQIASTLSLLGFVSSKSIVLDQVDALAALVADGQAGEAAILNVAGALVQVDENLASLTQSGRGEVEKITDEAQRAVARQTREGLDQVKQSIVDYVSSQWDVRHLQQAPAELDAITGALRMIPLAQAADLLQRCQNYLRLELMAGHVPTWEELDRLADALSGIDYYLERLASDSPGGAEDVLDVVQRSLDGLEATAATASVEPGAAPAPTVSETAVEAEPAFELELLDDAEPEEAPAAAADEPLFGAAAHVDVAAISDDEESEPELVLEADEDFDLGNALFDDLSEDDLSEDDLSEDDLSEDSEPAGDDLADLIDEVAETTAGAESADAPDHQPANVMAASPLAAVAPVQVDNFESDDEIIEIFVEEVDEVLAAVDEHLQAWEHALTDEFRQTEIRRAFHTLKGSGRMVGANVLGEMAWSVENMLNRVLDGTVAATADFVSVVREARALAPQLKAAFERKVAAETSGVTRIIEQADVLASGGTLADTAPAAEQAAMAVEADDDSQLFITEAELHLASLREATRDGAFVLDDEPMRALHTLSGSAAMAGLAAVGELAAPAYELAQALRKPGTPTRLTGEQAGFFQQVSAAMTAVLVDMKAGREPEDHFQLIADADRLLMSAEAPAGPSTVLALPALGALVKASELLDGWRDGSMDMSLADDVREALADVERTAHAEGQTPLSALAGALLGAHERFEFETLNDAAGEVFARGHEALLAQLDALAAGQTPADTPELRAAIGALRPGAESPEPDVGAAADDIANTSAAEDAGDRSGHEDFSLDLELEELPEPEAWQEPAEVSAAPQPQRHEPAPERHAPAAAAVEFQVPDDVDEDIIAVFFEEADEILEAFDHGISAWADEPDNRLHLENLLRGLHTLKGGARLSGLTSVGDATHDFESFLIEFQESARPAVPALFDDLHGRYDDIAALLGRTRAAISRSRAALSQSAAADNVPAVTEAPAPRQPEPVEHDLPAAHAEGLHDEATRAQPIEKPQPSREGAKPPREGAKPAAAPAKVATLRHARRSLADSEGGDARADAAAAQARTAQEMVRVGAGLLETLVNLAGESSIIRARVEQGMSDFTSALDEMETTIERLREQLRRLEIETEAQILFRQERLDGPSYEDFDPLEMDRYSQLQQLSRSLGESASDMLDLKDTLLFKSREAETLLLQQARVNTELQEGLMRSRMVPFSRLLPRLRRTVRQVAKELDKDVELHAFNVEGELDRTLLERMVPPLEHMLRNAVDHGIEKPGERRSHGKAEAGRIDLRLSREGGDVVIEIADDGAGIDVERVRSKAVERGLMASDAELRDEEISQFVLAPGFSTAASVTQISGRGVGMDVVHSEVKQLGGSINIFSERGRGTRFVLRVPFTVSVNRALMVSVGDDLYAIPLNTIEGIVLLAPNELERLYAPDGHTFEYAGVPYRVQYLGSFLGREYHPQPMQGSVPVVLVRSGEHAVAVHVDGVQGSREIVVKSLGPQFAGVGGISGATILGDGSVVVILDLLALIRTQSGTGLGIARRGFTGASRTRCIMVVDDSVTVRKVTSRLLERQGMDVVVAKDGVEAVSLLQERRPDVMLLDIEMPRMDGFEVLRQVRHDERLRNLPIVMISSRTGTKHQERAAELGVSRFLGKPFQESELLATIDELVN